MTFFEAIQYVQFTFVIFFAYSFASGLYSYQSSERILNNRYLMLCAVNLLYAAFNFAACRWQFPRAMQLQIFPAIYAFGFLAHLIYMDLIREFLGITHPALVWARRFFLGLSVFCALSFAAGLITGTSPFMEAAPSPHRSLLLNFATPGLTQSMFSRVLIGIGGNAIAATLVYFFYRIRRDFRTERLLLFGVVESLLVQANDVAIGQDLYQYLLPLSSLGFASEAIRFNLYFAKKAAARIHQLSDRVFRMAKLAELGHLASQLSHDLRRPVREIETATGDETILRNTKLISETIHFYLARSADDAAIDEAIPVALRDVLAATERFYRDDARAKRVRFKFDVNPEIRISASETELFLLLSNLMENSLDAIRDQSDPWIEVVATSGESDVRVLFTDSGTGLSDTVKSNLFRTRFTTKKHGYGMGLNIVQSISHKLGGVIYLVPEPANTTFCLELPRA